LQILDNDLLASSSNDHTIKIWSLKEYKLKHSLRGHFSSVHCLKKANNGDLISSSEDNTIKIWCSSNNFKCLLTLYGHKKSIYFMDVMPNGNLITGSLDTYIKIWDIEKGICLKVIDSKYQIHCLKYLTHGYVFVGKSDGMTRHKKKKIKQRNMKILDINQDGYNVIKRIEGDSHNVELSPDGHLFTCSNSENLIRAYKITFQ
jgi:WD40 repeat protein